VNMEPNADSFVSLKKQTNKQTNKQTITIADC
jgi:hypothetical protein